MQYCLSVQRWQSLSARNMEDYPLPIGKEGQSVPVTIITLLVILAGMIAIIYAMFKTKTRGSTASEED